MSLSLFLRNVVIGAALTTAAPSLVLAQAGFSTNGGEYAITAPLGGDQTAPRASLSNLGGYLVWRDSAADRSGAGICALALDSNFTNTTARFRVNQKTAGMMDDPSVALLKDGGAVFVWQSGKPGLQHIYARFLSPTNTWLTGDVLVNSFTNNFQRHPAVTVLADGNVVVVYGSQNQRSSSSLQDVYAQILNADGTKIGAEFLVNQFVAYNQRAPAIAALPAGGFVVAWVSEQQRSQVPDNSDANHEFYTSQRPSVDVYARVFDKVGAPLGSEFLVNSAANVCAAPAIGVLNTGDYVVAWAEKNTSFRTNGNDVLLRPCSGPATAGAAVRVNTHIYGDQYAPQVSSLGSKYLVVWTSLGQDGSWEGVYGRFVAAEGTPTGAEFCVNTTRASRQIEPSVASDGAARFLVSWSSFTGIRRGFDLFAQHYAVEGYVSSKAVVAYGAPKSNSSSPGTENLDGGEGDLDISASAPPAAAFAATSAASNSFAIIQGTYNGLFYDSAHMVDATRCGALNITVAARGAFSGKLYNAGKTYTFSGKFNSRDGWATNTIRRGLSSSIILRLQFDAEQGYQLGGNVADVQNSWVADLHADRLVYNRTTRPATLTGKTVNYTVILNTNQATGYGYGTMSLTPAGLVSWSGTLPDGTKVSQSTTLSADGYWPLFSSLSGGTGVLLGWMQLTSQADKDLSGDAVWTKPASAVAKYYPEGVTNGLKAIGAVYTAPATGKSVMGLTQGQLAFNGGAISAFTNLFAFDSRNKVTSPSSNHLSMSFTTSGLFTGSTRIPATTKSLSFQGVLFPLGTNGAGMFLGTKQSGRVELTPVH